MECSAFLVGLWLSKQLQPFVFRLLVLLLFITVFNEAASFFGFYKLYSISSSYMYNIFFIIQSLFFWQIFRKQFEQKKYQVVLNYGSLVLITLQIVSLYFWGAKKFNPWFLNIVCFQMVFIASLYFISIYSGNRIMNVFRSPFFWLSTGLIFVNIVHWFFVNATFIKSFTNSPSSAIVFKSLNTIGNVVYYSLIIYAFICSSRLLKRNIIL